MAAFVFTSFILLGFAARGNAQTAPAARITAPLDETVLTRLAGNTHPLARPEFDQGTAPLNLPMDRMLLVLRRSPEQESALQALLDQQHDKSSANYHRWLTPDEFGQQFGPADQDIQAITSWLQSHGFQVARVGRGRTAIEFSGTAAQVRDAFHAEIHGYLAGGAQHWANATDPQIPAALAPVVSGVAALHNFPIRPLLHVAGAFSKSAATGEVKPIGAPFASPGTNLAAVKPQFTFSQCQPACYALGPYDFGTIYNVLPLWQGTPVIDGTGQSIAIVGQSNINLQDVRDFRSMFGLPVGLPVNDPEIIVDGPDPGLTHDTSELEALLDVEWSGAVAPGAKIKFITSASTLSDGGADLSALYGVDNDVAPVLSVSFGLCELFMGTTGNQFHSALWEQAAAEGITVVVATGDSGSAGCDNFDGIIPQPAQFGLAVSGWASTPFNVAVGGTDFMNFGPTFALNSPSPYWNATNNARQASARGYVPESTWNDSCTSDGLAFLGFERTAEARCNDSALVSLVRTEGGSGGKSSCMSTSSDGVTCIMGYRRPSWQTISLSDTVRDVPDVSLFASNNVWGSFYIVCEADALPVPSSCNLNNGFANFIGVGGTSASAPAFAGIMALVNQNMNSLGLSNAQGNANYELYKLPSLSSQSGLNCNSTGPTGPASGCIFNDVTLGTIAMPCAAGSPNCTVSTGGDTYGVVPVPGYSGGTGYDLATGLGSVNAFNLVQSWSQVTFNPTSTTLSLDKTSITHGQSVTVSVTVSGTSGVQPTGDVSLITSSVNGEGVDSHALSGATPNSSAAIWSTSQLPGSGGVSYNVHAHYPGDGTFGASDSPPIAVSVTPEDSTTTVSALTISPVSGRLLRLLSGPYGSFVYLRADVAPAVANSADGPATGGVTFMDNGSTIPGSPFSLNSQSYTVTPNGIFTLAPGAHSISARYNGDNSYNRSTSASPANFTVTQAATQAAIQTPQNEVALNSMLTLFASINTNVGVSPLTGAYDGAALPTGTVTFFLRGTALGPAVPVTGSVSQVGTTQASATATYSTTSPFSFGENAITAVYSGDANYLTSTSQAVTVQVVTPDFTLSDSLGVGNIVIGAPGQSSAPVTLTISGTNGYNGTIVFGPASCVIAPAGSLSNCSFSPSSITGSGSTQLVINTTAPHAADIPGGRFGLDGRKLQPIAVFALFLVTFAIFKTQRRLSVAFGSVILLALFALWACGGAGGAGSGGGTTNTIPGTPTGVPYAVSINAAPSGVNSHSINLTFIVQ